MKWVRRILFIIAAPVLFVVAFMAFQVKLVWNALAAFFSGLSEETQWFLEQNVEFTIDTFRVMGKLWKDRCS